MGQLNNGDNPKDDSMKISKISYQEVVLYIYTIYKAITRSFSKYVKLQVIFLAETKTCDF